MLGLRPLASAPLAGNVTAAASGANLSGGATDAADTSAGTIAAQAALSGGATDAADTSTGTLGAVVGLSGGTTDAPDASTGTLAAIASLSGGTTDGADSSAGTLGAQATLSGGATDGADASAGTIAADTTPRDLSGGATDDPDLSAGNFSGPALVNATGGWAGGRKRNKPWLVRRPDGAAEYFDDPKEAWLRFNELYAAPSPAPKRGLRKISVGAIPARAVQFEQTDATRDFAKLAREINAQREAKASARVVAQLRAIAIDAARRAAERDDEEAAMVLLML